MNVRNILNRESGNTNMIYENDTSLVIVDFKSNQQIVETNLLEVYIPGGGWINLKEAFDKKMVIPDQYANYFRETRSVIEKDRGFYEIEKDEE